jgi:threonine dehydratase
MSVEALPSFADVRAAAKRLLGVATRTSLLRSVELDRATGGRIWVKPECLQRSGSFKIRGAYSRLSALSDAERQRGVVAFSSGNHGQGVALAAKLLGIKATIVMPRQAPGTKIQKTRSHGAEIIFFDLKTESREEIAGEIAGRSGAVLVPSYDDPYVIAGQGTAAKEVIEDLAAQDITLDTYIACAGGGGLMAGTCLSFHALSPGTELYTAEPFGHDDHARSFAADERQTNAADAPESICDALLVPTPGELTFAVNRRYVKGGVAVSDAEVLAAVRFAADHLKLVAEPSGAVALAAVLSGRIETKGRKVGLIITGGNLDATDFAGILSVATS